MSGTDFLLDTNIILGVLKGHEPALDAVKSVPLEQCRFSVITRMELLSFPAITPEEAERITEFLACLKSLPLDAATENAVIALRQHRKIKLPDAIIAATALVHEATLLTLDEHLLSVYHQALAQKV